MCILHNFPSSITHTIQWARDRFEGMFYNPFIEAQAFLSQPDFRVQKFSDANAEVSYTELKKAIELAQNLKSVLSESPKSFDDCIKWARIKFQDLYFDAILQLLYFFPKDSKSTSGEPFWSGNKRAPEPIVFDHGNVWIGF